MLKFTKFGLILALACSTNAISEQNRGLCPEILEAAGIDTGLSSSELRELYRNMNSKGTFDLQERNEIVQTVVHQGKSSVNFKIQIEEYSPTQASPTKSIKIDCPVAKDWHFINLPRVALTTPPTILDVEDLDSPFKPSRLIKSGVRLYKYFPESPDFFSINLLWYLSLLESDNAIDLPDFMKNKKHSNEDLTIKDEKRPVRGIRFATSKSFGNIWYLLTKKSNSEIRDLNFLPMLGKDSPFLNGTGFSDKIASLEHLEYFNSLSGTVIPCESILAKEYRANCYNYNAQLNPELWDSLKGGETVYLQALIPLSRGYLLQTYQIDSLQDKSPNLVKQEFKADLNEFKIPDEIF